MTDFKFERSSNNLLSDFAVDILNCIVNKKAILPHFQDEMIRWFGKIDSLILSSLHD